MVETVATLTLRASNQELNGNIVADSISTVALDMTNGSSLVGAVNTDNTAKEITMKLSKDLYLDTHKQQLCKILNQRRHNRQ